MISHEKYFLKVDSWDMPAIVCILDATNRNGSYLINQKSIITNMIWFCLLSYYQVFIMWLLSCHQSYFQHSGYKPSGIQNIANLSPRDWYIRFLKSAFFSGFQMRLSASKSAKKNGFMKSDWISISIHFTQFQHELGLVHSPGTWNEVLEHRNNILNNIPTHHATLGFRLYLWFSIMSFSASKLMFDSNHLNKYYILIRTRYLSARTRDQYHSMKRNNLHSTEIDILWRIVTKYYMIVFLHNMVFLARISLLGRSYTL